MYQSGLTIKDALEAVSKNLYVLPAIQREFVWKPEQISRLFDSLMQGYPFGTFLFWKVEPEQSAQFNEDSAAFESLGSKATPPGISTGLTCIISAGGRDYCLARERRGRRRDRPGCHEIELKIVAGFYDLATGSVTLLD
jgi:hypothetical protein